MVKLLLFLSLLVCQAAYAQVYLLGQAGYSQLNQSDAAANNVHPSGITYGAGAGFRNGFFEFEGTLLKANLSGDINHDGEDNTLNHAQTSMLLAFNFYLTKRFYVRLGYGFHKVDQTLGDGVSAASQEGAERAYGMKEDALTEGVIYGGGYVIYDSNRLGLYTQIENMTMSTLGASAWNASLGFRWYLR